MLNRETKKITVIGAGLSGLVSIIECINKAKQNPSDFFELSIIEKRSLNFNRRQKLIICRLNEFRSGTFPATYWQEFCEKNFDPYGDIKRQFNQFNQIDTQRMKPSNYREKFLYKLWRQENYYEHKIRNTFVFKNFSIKELQLALYEHIGRVI